MKVKEILALLDASKLKEIGDACAVDKANNKITGEFVLLSFVMSSLTGCSTSLRSIEELTKKDKSLSNKLKSKDMIKKSIDHSGLGKRLRCIKTSYFENIYEHLVEKYSNLFPTNKKTITFDSTIISISGKLMKEGLNMGGKDDNRHIKVTISLKNSIPSNVRFCDDQSDASENVALLKAINEAKLEKEDILLFDRGISKGDTFADLEKEERMFVTRVSLNRKHKVIKKNEVKVKADDKIKILS